MARLNDEHLTTEQLSASLNEQLSPEEQAVVDTHLRTCERCQQVLADLRQTVALLHALPQAEVPRSFVLPTRIAPVSHAGSPEQVRPLTPSLAHRQRVWHYAVRGSIRAVSTIAAVLGLIFILSGIIVTLPHGGSNTASTAGSAGTTSTTHRVTNPPPAAGHETPAIKPGGTLSPHASPISTSTPTPTSRVKTAPSTGPPAYPTSSVPAVLDLSKPEGHLGIGSILMLLGILGFAFTRRRVG